MTKFHSKDTNVYVGDSDVTGDSTSVEPSFARVLSEQTTFGDGGRSQIPDISEDSFSYEGLFDDASGSADETFEALRGTSDTVTVWPAGDDRESIGYGHGAAFAREHTVQARIGEIVTIRSTGQFQDTVDRLKSLEAKQTVSSSTDGTSIDDGSSSANGGSWIYHVFAVSASGGNAQWKLRIEDSADDNTFATVSSEEVTISATGSARRVFTGTLRRYVRIAVELDATSGSITFQASYERD